MARLIYSGTLPAMTTATRLFTGPTLTTIRVNILNVIVMAIPILLTLTIICIQEMGQSCILKSMMSKSNREVLMVHITGMQRSGIDSMRDRFGNTLSYSWNNDKTAVTSVSNGHATIGFDMQDDHYTEVRLQVGQDVYRTIQFDYDPNDPITYSVTKKGNGVNELGVYDAVSDKEYVTKYQYDSGKNLRKIINVNNSDQDETLIEVDYDGYGRVQARRDYLGSANYQETTFKYIFEDPNSSGDGDNLVTVKSTDSRDIVTIQNDDGAAIWQEIITSDGSAVTDANSIYEDPYNKLQPTEMYEYFDGYQRRTWNDYDFYGNLLEQHIHIDENNYISTELEYHPDYAFETSRTSWQDVNETGEKVQKLSLYGDYDGTENQYGDYLVKEKVLLYDGNPTDPGDDIWAVTSYEYYNTAFKKGLVKEIIDPGRVCHGYRI